MLCVATVSVNSYAGSVRAFLDRDTIFVTETVLLTIEVAGLDNRDDSPDIGRLTADFNIIEGGREVASNGTAKNANEPVRWVFKLEPKRSGAITLPALAINRQLKTSELTLTVLAQDPTQQVTTEDIFVEVLVEPINPYVQAQVRYSERLFYAIPLRERLRQVQTPGADLLMQPLGDEIKYVAEREGRRYTVIERNYALFAQRSGIIEIPQLVYTARTLPKHLSRAQQAGYSELGQRIEVRGERVLLNVRPRPEPPVYTGQYWLPSDQLLLQESWSQEPPQFRVGEPITRTLTLQARGLDAAQLPQLNIPAISQANIYPDQETSQSRHDGAWIFGRREQRMAIVPTQAGEFTLAEIRLPWWDTGSDSAQVALIPARTIKVLAAATEAIVIDDNVGAAEDGQVARQAVPKVGIGPVPSRYSDADLWRWSTWLLLLLWLVTLLLWQQERKRRLRDRSPVISKARRSAFIVTHKAARQALQQACKDNNPQAAARALLAWAMLAWPEAPPTNLATLALRLRSSQAKDAILALEQVLYSPDATTWQGRALWQVLKSGLAKQLSNTPTYPLADGLMPLYPQRL